MDLQKCCTFVFLGTFVVMRALVRLSDCVLKEGHRRRAARNTHKRMVWQMCARFPRRYVGTSPCLKLVVHLLRKRRPSSMGKEHP